MAQITHTQTVNMGDGNANCNNIIGSFINNYYMSDEDAQIMRWLSPLEPSNRHQGVRNERFDGVGDWLLETSEFRQWRSSEDEAYEAILFCSGNPGVGKTYLSSLVIDSLCDRAKTKDIAITCFYCDYKAQQEQTTANMVGAILKQLVGRRGIPDYIREAFQEGKMEIGGRGLRLADLMGMLSIAIASIDQVFICIDALDECLPKHLSELLESLRDIVWESPKVRIFLTGRPHIGVEIQRYFTQAVTIPVSPSASDIKSYVKRRLDRDPEPEAMSDALRVEIFRTISEKISDIFLLVSLNMDAILGEVTIRQRRKKLEEMAKGKGLSDAYTATLGRLKAQKGNKSVLGLKVLMWVLYSERPLRAEELRHALGVETGTTDLDIENAPALRTLVASSLGLVTVETSSSTVRLVHYTLQEHLLRDPTLFPSPHSAIAEVCLTYLNFRSVRQLSPTLDSAPPTMPFLEYASCYWGKHTTRGVTDNVKTLVLRLLERFDKHIATQLMLLCSNRDRHYSPHFAPDGGPEGFSGLHGAAFLGIVEIAASVLEANEWDVNATDGMGLTALIWAAVRGHEELVKLLLEREAINPDKADTVYGRTPLSWAAEHGCEGVVKMLLERKDVDPNTIDTKSGSAPLLWAAFHGHEGVVKMLLQREGVNPNTVGSKSGGTPLLWAAFHGHEGVAKILLQQEGVNPNQVDSGYGRTPLYWAVRGGHEGVVKMLLQREDVNPNLRETTFGQAPLSRAAFHGNERLVRMLLERGGTNPGQADTKYGQTPLSWAAKNGHEGVVKMLLQREDVNPNRADIEYDQSPLSWAAENGHEGVVKTLLQRNDVNPDQASTKSGRSPLSLAASGGHGGVAKLLLQRKDVNPNTVDTKYGSTPLSWAAFHGHEGVVNMFLERKDVNPDQADTLDCRSPLSCAAECGHEGVVRMLLKRRDVNPNTIETEYGRTALSQAAKLGYEGVVKILLERKDVLTTIPDNEGQTSLSLAISAGHHGIAKILQERGNFNSDTQNPAGQPSAPPPIQHGGRNMVAMPSTVETPNPDTVDLDSKPVLPYADPYKPNAISDPHGSLFGPAPCDISSTELPATSHSSSKSHPDPTRSLTGANTHPHSFRSTISILFSQYFTITFLTCLFTFLVCTPPPSFLDKF